MVAAKSGCQESQVFRSSSRSLCFRVVARDASFLQVSFTLHLLFANNTSNNRFSLRFIDQLSHLQRFRYALYVISEDVRTIQLDSCMAFHKKYRQMQSSRPLRVPLSDHSSLSHISPSPMLVLHDSDPGKTMLTSESRRA